MKMTRYLGKAIAESLIGHVSVCEKPVILRASASGRLTCHGYCAVTGIKGAADL